MAKFEPGRPKLGGRTKGTPNKLKSVREICALRGCSPVDILIDEMMDHDSQYRVQAARDILPYLYPKLTVVDLSAEELIKLAEEKLNGSASETPEPEETNQQAG